MNKSKKIILEIFKCLIYTVLGAGIGIVFSLDLDLIIKLITVFLICLLIVLAAVLLNVIFDKRSNNNNMTRVSYADNNARIERNTKLVDNASVLDQKPLAAQKKELREMSRTVATKLVLINEEGTGLLSWDLTNRSSLIIGKSTDKEPVDVDLSVSAVSQMISKQHAVLNYTEKGWYIDDIDSKNGTRVKKHEQNAIMDVKLVGAVELAPGDIIYIANAMLQIQ